jgi:hypothetical protein
LAVRQPPAKQRQRNGEQDQRYNFWARLGLGHYSVLGVVAALKWYRRKAHDFDRTVKLA